MSENNLILLAVKGAIKGDRKSQRLLYDTYRVKWYMICLRYMSQQQDAEDALQNGLVQIFSKLNQFDEKKGNFSSWSCKTMVNECLMILRKRSSKPFESDIDDAYDVYDNTETAIEMMSKEELMILVRKLPTGYRTIFNLYAIEGHTHVEISEKLGISVGTSKSQLFKARKMLQEALTIIMS